MKKLTLKEIIESAKSTRYTHLGPLGAIAAFCAGNNLSEETCAAAQDLAMSEAESMSAVIALRNRVKR